MVMKTQGISPEAWLNFADVSHFGWSVLCLEILVLDVFRCTFLEIHSENNETITKCKQGSIIMVKYMLLTQFH